MTHLIPVPLKGMRARGSVWLLGLLALGMASCTATRWGKPPGVAKWGRFEQAFQSSAAYSNAIQQATLTVLFLSPLGETNRVCGFWDGGQTWRVRFSPGQAGRWSYQTICSDGANRGLHQRTGAFHCIAPGGTNRFDRHGPVRLARDRRHFEHADGAPFFWLADLAVEGARMSDPQSWERYAGIRAGQYFSVVQWSAAAGADWSKQTAFAGRDRIAVNPEFFQRLDAKVDALNKAGILSAIVPFWEIDLLPGKPTEGEVISLLRYMVARWGANDVAWLLPLDGPKPAERERYRRVGRAVFGEAPHAPVMLGSGVKEFAQFQNEHWADAFAYESDAGKTSLPDYLSGPFVAAWQQEPVRPLLNLAPAHEDTAGQAEKPGGDADAARRAAWWSLLLAPPAGVGYTTIGVVAWNSTTNPPSNRAIGEGLPLWLESLSLPGAKHMTVLAKIMNSMEFWRLVPSPESVAAQPGLTAPRRYIAAAATATKDLTVVYVPEDRAVELFLSALPPSPLVSWISPRTGETSPAVAVIADGICQFPTPDPGDWLLLIKAGE